MPTSVPALRSNTFPAGSITPEKMLSTPAALHYLPQQLCSSFPTLPSFTHTSPAFPVLCKMSATSPPYLPSLTLPRSYRDHPSLLPLSTPMTHPPPGVHSFRYCHRAGAPLNNTIGSGAAPSSRSQNSNDKEWSCRLLVDSSSSFVP